LDLGYAIAMITIDSIRRQRDAILEIARRHGARDVRIFGSVARGDATERSDLDLVVTFERGRTLLDHAGLIGDLEDLLDVKVDVIDADGMRPRFRAVVEREASPL
jgi:predicted nucleotidyltransferase